MQSIKKEIPSKQIVEYMKLLELYRHPQISHYITSMETPELWNSSKWAAKQDNLVSYDNPNSYDFLVDLYHYKEISRFFKKDQMKSLKGEFAALDESDQCLSEEQLVLVLLKVINLPVPAHLPYLINGIRQLYAKITSKFCQCQGLVSYPAFMEFYYNCQLVTSIFESTDDLQEKGQLLEFEELKKDKHGFQSSKLKDVQHHDHAIKSVQFADEFKWIFTLDEESNYFRIYDSNNITLIRKVYCESTKHKTKEIRLLDIHYSNSEKAFGACCQDLKISFWTANNKFTHEYCFPCDKFGIQLKIFFIELTKSWITINQNNQIVEWRFINQIDGGDNQKNILIKLINRNNSIKISDNGSNEVNNKVAMFTNSSVAEGKLWTFRSSVKICQILEVIQIKKLLISTFDKKITVWDPIKGGAMAIIRLPLEFSSAHTLAYSERLNIILTGGFDQFIILWRLDQNKQDYSKIHQIEVAESGLSISTAGFFDQYGLLVTLDESGMMKAWDFEKWNLTLKFDLGCQIRNTLSSLIKLDDARFVIVTQRLRIFEFPSKEPRRLKAKLQPLNQIEYDMREHKIIIGSQNQIFALNINNALVEEKYTPDNSNIQNVAFFFVSYNLNRIITIGQQGELSVLGPKSSQQELLYLLDDQKLNGCIYHQTYDLLTAWSSTIIRIYRGSEAINTDKINFVRFMKIRQISMSDIDLVRIHPEREIICVLVKRSVLQFITYNRLDPLGTFQLDQIDIQDFEIILDYNMVVIVDVFQDIWFVKQNKYQQFEITLKIDRLTFSKNQLFIPFENICLQKTSDHHVKQLIQQFLMQNQIGKESNNKANNKNNNDIFAETQQGFQVLFELKELEFQKRKLKGQLANSEKKKAKKSFRKAVYNVILLIRGASSLMTKQSQFQKSSLNYKESIKDSIKSNSSILNKRASEYQQQILRQFTKAKMKPKFQPKPKQSQDMIEDNQAEINYEFYQYNIAHVLEDFRFKYYLVLTNNLGQYTLLNLNTFLREYFTLISDEYQNKFNLSILSTTIEVVDDIQLIQIQNKVDEASQLQQYQIKMIQWENHQRSSLIDIRLISFYDHTVLFTFSRAESVLKAWDVSQIQDNSKFMISPEYIECKYQYVRNYNKYNELQRTLGVKESELQEQMVNLQEARRKCIQCVSYQVDDQMQFYSGPICEGLYVLPTETKIKWNLKDFNLNYRRLQIVETIKFMKKLLERWQMANKYQVQMLQVQIQKHKNVLGLNMEYSSQTSQSSITPQIKVRQKEKAQLESKKKSDKSYFNETQAKPDQTSFSSLTHKESSVSIDKNSKDSPSRSIRSKTLYRPSQADSLLNQSSNDDRISKTSVMKSSNQLVKQSKQKNRNYQKMFPTILHESINEDEEDQSYFSKGKKHFISSESLEKAQKFNDFVSSSTNRVQQINKELNNIYFPLNEKQLARMQKQQKQTKIISTEQIPAYAGGKKVEPLKKLNLRTSSREKIRYLHGYNFEELSQVQLEGVQSIIDTNRSTNQELSVSSRNYLVHYKERSQLLSKVKSNSRQHLLKDLDISLKKSKNLKQLLHID